MSKYGATYDRSNVPCKSHKAYASAKGLTMEAADRDGACVIVVTLKQTSPRNKHEREFVHWTVKLGVQVRACEPQAIACFATREQVAADVSRTGSAVFECYGSIESLDSLRTLPFVERWAFAMVGSPSVRLHQQGSGPEKVKATKPKVKPLVIWGGTPEENGMTAKPNDTTVWESHQDAMGTLVKGVGSLKE